MQREGSTSSSLMWNCMRPSLWLLWYACLGALMGSCWKLMPTLQASKQSQLRTAAERTAGADSRQRRQLLQSTVLVQQAAR